MLVVWAKLVGIASERKPTTGTKRSVVSLAVRFDTVDSEWLWVRMLYDGGYQLARSKRFCSDGKCD
jgi:hypothetical protein